MPFELYFVGVPGCWRMRWRMRSRMRNFINSRWHCRQTGPIPVQNPCNCASPTPVVSPLRGQGPELSRSGESGPERLGLGPGYFCVRHSPCGVLAPSSRHFQLLGGAVPDQSGATRCRSAVFLSAVFLSAVFLSIFSLSSLCLLSVSSLSNGLCFCKLNRSQKQPCSGTINIVWFTSFSLLVAMSAASSPIKRPFSKSSRLSLRHLSQRATSSRTTPSRDLWLLHGGDQLQDTSFPVLRSPRRGAPSGPLQEAFRPSRRKTTILTGRLHHF
jgi:hypothetical protein